MIGRVGKKIYEYYMKGVGREMLNRTSAHIRGLWIIKWRDCMRDIDDLRIWD